MRKTIAWLSLLSLLIAVPDAQAANREAKERAANREAKERAAKRACLNGESTKGVQILTDLYIDTSDPTYIYNQGRCYEQNNHYEEAIGRFREYLRKISSTTDADKADAASAQKHITDCEALLGRKVAAPAPPPTPEPPKPQPEPTAPRLPEPTVKLDQSPSPTGASPAGRGLRVAGIVTAAVGAAALAAGVALNFKANGMIDDLQNRYDSGSYSSSKHYRTMSQIGYGAGAVCLAGGALLYYLGVRGGVAVAPAVARGTAGVTLTGGF